MKHWRIGFDMVLGAVAFNIGALAAQTLPPVSPPTDWTGVAIVALIGIIAVAVAAYIVHIKRTPGKQMGEEEIERISESLFRKQAAPPAPIVYDGTTFPDQSKLDEYKAAKAIVDAAKGGTT